ncbi:tyrosine-type recombinase/integrase [uncultured Amnibacterium sp.]|uniref:tyrosine-type recombinase/integrase n=1 Tax=uncultured Amnibacterium sp. TaxID=1631851 RepID=UPI0035CB7D42
MVRPRLPIATAGDIACSTADSGTVTARIRFRDWDGVTRMVQASGRTRAAAERALKEKLAARAEYRPGNSDLTADSTFKDLADYWLADMEGNPDLAPGTKRLYRWNMTHLVLPEFEHLTLREIGVARCDRFIKQLRQASYSRAKHARNVLRQAFGRAVRHEVLVRNPMESIARTTRPRADPTALTAIEVTAIRLAIRAWERGSGGSGPSPDGQLGAIVEVMLGTSARIGEVLAIRRRDIDAAVAPPTIRLAGTIVCPTGAPPERQDHPKTARRTVAVPSFAAEAARRRLAVCTDRSPDALLFSSRNGTPLTPNNVRNQLRRVLARAGLDDVSPHTFPRTVATAVHAHAGVDLAAELLGHADPRITVQHYIRRNEMVNPTTAEILEAAFPPLPEE